MNTDLRLFIYEQYGNGQIDRDTARALNPGQMNAIKARNNEVASLYDKFQGFKWIKIVNDVPAN